MWLIIVEGVTRPQDRFSPAKISSREPSPQMMLLWLTTSACGSSSWADRLHNMRPWTSAAESSTISPGTLEIYAPIAIGWAWQIAVNSNPVVPFYRSFGY